MDSVLAQLHGRHFVSRRVAGNAEASRRPGLGKAVAARSCLHPACLGLPLLSSGRDCKVEKEGL